MAQRTIVVVNMFKKIALFIATMSLSVMLYLTASLWIANQTILNPQIIKKWANDSGLYTNIIPAALDVVDNPSTESSIPLQDDAIRAAGQAAFNDKVLKSTTEQAIDQVSTWLQNGGTLTINLDLSEPRAAFAAGIGDVAATRLAALPTCGVTIPQSFDVFAVACLPKGVDPVAEGNKLSAELVASDSFLGTGKITNETLGITDQTHELFTLLPKAYQTRTVVVIAALMLTAVLSLIIIFCSTVKRKGIRRVARTYIIMAIILASTAFVVPYLTSTFAAATNSSSDQAFVEKIVKPLVNQIERSIVHEHIIASAVIGVIGVVLVVYLLLTRTKKIPPQDTSEYPFNNKPTVVDKIVEPPTIPTV